MASIGWVLSEEPDGSIEIYIGSVDSYATAVIAANDADAAVKEGRAIQLMMDATCGAFGEIEGQLRESLNRARVAQRSAEREVETLKKALCL